MGLDQLGDVPFVVDEASFRGLGLGDFIYLPGLRRAVAAGAETVEGFLIKDGDKKPIVLRLPGLTTEEREIILAGCLINHYAGK